MFEAVCHLQRYANMRSQATLKTYHHVGIIKLDHSNCSTPCRQHQTLSHHLTVTYQLFMAWIRGVADQTPALLSHGLMVLMCCRQLKILLFISQAEGAAHPSQRRRTSSQRPQIQAPHVLHHGGRRPGGGQDRPHSHRCACRSTCYSWGWCWNPALYTT